MAYVVVDKEQLEADLGIVCDAIREKGGTSEPLAFPNGMADAVRGIQSGGGSGAVIYEETLTEPVAYATVPLSTFEGCTSLFVQLYIPSVNEESYSQYIPRIGFIKEGGVWSNTKIIASNGVADNSNKLFILNGTVKIDWKKHCIYFEDNNYRIQYGTSKIGVNSATFGNKFNFDDTYSIVFEIYSRTYQLPIGTEFVIIGC